MTWDPSCTATVGDYRACRDAQYLQLSSDPCSFVDGEPPECDWLVACLP